ncbi:hypothetical protein ACP275_08G144100 [Erythranthe tilingii]
MEAGSEEENNMNMDQIPAAAAASKRPKRQMKTPFQLEVLEKAYATDMYPSEAARAVLSKKLDLSDRQLQMWFCHRRLKNKKDSVGMAAAKPHTAGSVQRTGVNHLSREELMMASDPGSGHGSGSRSGKQDSGSGSGSDSGSSQFNNGDGMPIRYFESHGTVMARRVIARMEAQLGEPLREDGPILGVEFDELPHGAFGETTVRIEEKDRYKHSYDRNLYGQSDVKHMKAASDGPSAKTMSIMRGNGHVPRGYGAENQVSSMDIMSQSGRHVQPSSSPRNMNLMTNHEDNQHIERKRKSDEVGMGREVQAHEKKNRKELEKQDVLRRKREEQMKKEIERQDRERRKEEQRMMREQQRQEEKFQREEKRELERREKFMQKELLLAERKKQKEERCKEKEAARQKIAAERAAARRIAKESMELMEDERLELMELAASSKGLPSILSLDYDTLQNLDSFRDALCVFPPKSVQLKTPFAIQPWIDSEENVGNLLMVWKFCITFADVLGLWPFTLDEFVQAFHDYDSRLLGEIHIALIKLIIKDIEDVARMPSGGPGTNQYNAVNTEGGHPHIVEGAYLWGFDIHSWQKHLNPLTWPEILRQFSLAAGFGPQLKKKGIYRVGANENDESKGCEDIVSTLRNGSAAENAVAIMREKGVSFQRRSRHRLTPGTVKFAAYHVLALEGSKGLNVIDLAEKIQKSGLRDFTTSKTPEASISVALSRDPILFERIAPSTYCVRPAFRKDPADTESVIAEAKEKIRKYANGFLAGQNADEEERDDDSDGDVTEAVEADVLATPSDANKNSGSNEVGSCSVNDKDKIADATPLQEETIRIDVEGNLDQDVEIDVRKSGESWVQGLSEGEYSDLSVEERLKALVALTGIANEGNSIRVNLEDRQGAASALKKQMWAEAQLDKRRMTEEINTRLYNSSFNAVLEGGLSPLVIVENKLHDPSTSTLGKDGSSVVAEDVNCSVDYRTQDTSMDQFISQAQQNGYTTERSRLQLKSYIGHIAEEIYVHRSLPLGQDRRRNRYWLFIASSSSLDPGSGRIFVESPDGHWKLIDSVEAFDALLTSLDTRGTRESHLHIMLKKIEACFKNCVQKNQLIHSISYQNRDEGRIEALEVNSSHFCSSAESPRSVVCSSSSDACEPSLSFRVQIGRNETERKNFLKRYEDLQIWMRKECFSSSFLCGMAHEKKRCSPLLGTCDICFGTYDAKKDLCPSCHGNKSTLIDESSTITSNISPVRIGLIKALLTLLEVTVPSEALRSCWTEDFRNTWGSKLQSSSSSEDLLQILTEFEGAINREYISVGFETTEELLSSCVSSRGAAFEFTDLGSVSQLPWIPKTTAAVALRLLELDSSISYTPNQIADSQVEPPPKFILKYADTVIEFSRSGSVKEENRDHFTPRISGNNRQVVRKKGSGRPSKSKKKSGGSLSKSGKKQSSITEGESLAQTLTHGQKHGRGRRTVRRRRTEQKNVTKTLNEYFEDQPINSGKNDNSRNNIAVENYESSHHSIEESDDNANENVYEFRKLGSPIPMDVSEEEQEEDDASDQIDDENGYNEEINDEGNHLIDEGSESDASGDYSD